MLEIVNGWALANRGEWGMSHRCVARLLEHVTLHRQPHGVWAQSPEGGLLGLSLSLTIRGYSTSGGVQGPTEAGKM